MGLDVRALGFGDNVVDRYEHQRIMYPGGNAANFAVYARMCGTARAAYMGIFGSDEAGEHVIASLAQEGVECVACEQLIGENGAARVTLVDGDRVFLGSNEGGIRGEARRVLDRFDLEYIARFDVVHTGSYGFTERELPKIRSTGALVSFDFSDDSADGYCERIAPQVDFAFLSAPDASSDGEVEDRLAWMRGLGPRFVAATRGERGCVAYDGGRWYRQPAEPIRELRDTMGAGDAFISAFLMSYLDAQRCAGGSVEPQGAAIGRALALAASFASTVCGMDGSWGHGRRYE